MVLRELRSGADGKTVFPCRCRRADTLFYQKWKWFSNRSGFLREPLSAKNETLPRGFPAVTLLRRSLLEKGRERFYNCGDEEFSPFGSFTFS